jgi:HK97 gp10 family phage protein
VDAICAKTAQGVEYEAKKSMSGPKHGRTYPRGAIRKNYRAGGRGLKAWAGSGAEAVFSGGRSSITVGYKIHRASAPGEAPAVDTANLRNSIETDKIKEGLHAVSTNAEYAAGLEFGTPKMAARPFFRPALEKMRAAFINALMALEKKLQ